MYFILAILLFIVIRLVVAGLRTGVQAGYNKATEPKDTLKKEERDADRVAKHFGMNQAEAQKYKNMQRFGICFARYALMVSMEDGELDPNELLAIIEFFDGADQAYIDSISSNIGRDLKHPGRIDWNHNNEVARELFNNPYFKDYDSILFDGLLRVAAADGNLDAGELKLITGIMAMLGWSHDRIRSHLDSRLNPDKTYSEEEKRNRAYETLGLPLNSSPEEIKSIYRTLVKQYHPDKVRHLGKKLQETATERFHEIKNAYEYLTQTA